MQINIQLHKEECYIVSPIETEGRLCPYFNWDKIRECGKYDMAIERKRYEDFSTPIRCKQCKKENK